MRLKSNSVNITQEVEFGRKVERMANWHKSVVSLILWFDVIDGQLVDPESFQNFSSRDRIHAVYLTRVKVSSPANMCDIYSGIRLDFYTILVPGSPHALI